jgi:hypothetical protein
MALSFGDIALSVGAGVAEKDMQIRDAEFKQALENFKEDKAHVKKLADLRYTRDLSKYDDEVKKYNDLKSAYADIGNMNLGENAAADLIAMKVYGDNYNNLQYKSQIREDIKSGFEYTYYTEEDKNNGSIPDGKDVGSKKSFTVSHPVQKITMPKESEYYLGNDYWKKAEENIGEKATPVTQELRKLLGKDDKGVDNTDYIKDLENKSKGEINQVLSGEFEKYTSTSVLDTTTSIRTTGELADNFNINKKGVVEGGGVDSQTYDLKKADKVEYEKDSFSQDSILLQLNKYDKNWTKENAKWNPEKKMWVINQSGSAVYDSLQSLWNNSSEFLFQKTFYKGGSGNSKDYNLTELKQLFIEEVENRKLNGLNYSTDETLYISPAFLPVGSELTNKKDLVDHLNNNVFTSTEWKDTYGKKGKFSNTVAHNAIQYEIQKYINANVSEDKLPSNKKEAMNFDAIDLVITANIDSGKSVEEILSNLEKGGATFNEGAKEKILEKYKSTDVQSGNVEPMPLPDMTNPDYFNWIKKYGDTHNQDGTPK